MRVTLSNVYSDDNRGGAAITAATIEIVKLAFPDAQISLVTVGSAVQSLEVSHRHTQQAFPDVELLPPALNFRRGTVGNAVEIIRSILALIFPALRQSEAASRVTQSDLVIGKGGQLFSSRFKGRGLLGLWASVYPLLLAKRAGAKAMVLGVTIGPYDGWSWSRSIAGLVLRRLDLCVVRDPRSYAEALNLGVRSSRLQRVPDCVLFLHPNEHVGTPLERWGLQRGKFAAITLPFSLDDPNQAEAGGLMADLSRRLIANEVVDHVAVVLQVDGQTTSDRSASEAFVAGVNDSRIRIVEHDWTVEDLLAFYGKALVTMGGRVHSNILSVIAGTPAFPVTVRGSHKPRDIFLEFGLDDWVLDSSKESAEEAYRRMHEVVTTNLEEAERRVAKAVETCRAQVEAFAASLSTIIGSATG